MTEGPGWNQPQQGSPNPADGQRQPPPGWGQPQAPPPPGWGQPQAPPPPGWGQQQPPPGWGQQQPGGGGQWGPQVQAEKPGIIPLRPLALGEILDGAFTAVRQNPGATIGLTVAATTVVQIVSTILTAIGQRSSSGTEIFFGLVGTGLELVVRIALAGALSIVVSEATLGSRMNSGEVLQRIRPRLGGLIGLSIAVTLLTILGIIGLLVGAVFVAVALALSTPAYVLEGGTIGTAMRRSWALVRGAWWRTFGILLLTGIIALVLGIVLGVVLGVIRNSSSMTDPYSGDLTALGLFVNAVLSIVVNTVTAPIIAGVVALVYIDRRIRLEGLDVTLAQTARDRAAASPRYE